MSTLFRFRYKKQGGHTHVRLFAGKGSLSLGLCGSLVFRNEEWEDFVGMISLEDNIEIKEEDE